MASKEAAESVKSKKIDLEIDHDTRKEIEVYIDAYNADPDRVTRRIRLTDVVNEALTNYLRKRKSRVTQ
ncbi:MAG TPA: hypothetical protein VMW87_08650 [Spirochaetia bacterium]|nr:hypothetical protein [Spirochaetia bacterium]